MPIRTAGALADGHTGTLQTFYDGPMRSFLASRFFHGRPVRLCFTTALCWAAASVLPGCGAAHLGVGVPVGPFTLGVGLGAGGPAVGVGTGVGPVGVGLGMDGSGRVSGGMAVGASLPVGGGPVRAGVGVGTGGVLYDPGQAPAQPGVVVPRSAWPVR